MNNRGGYQILDLSKDPFISGVSKTVVGSFYKAVTGNNRKSVLLSGISLKASSDATPVKYNDEFVSFMGDSSNVSTTLGNGTTVAITSSDGVTITLAN